MVVRRGWSAAVVSGFVLAGLAGCSSSGGSSGDATAAPTTAAASSTAAPTTAAAATTSPALPQPDLMMASQASFKDSQGYTYDLSLYWSADFARTDVGSEPPGKTDVTMNVTKFSGSFTNTTVGGRAMPDVLPTDTVVGIYPASSVVCRYQDNADVSSILMGRDELWVAKDGAGCAVSLYTFLGIPNPNGALYPDGQAAGIPNDKLIVFGVQDTEFNFADAPLSLNVTGADETRAAAWVKAVNHPLAFGITTGPNDVATSSGTPKCVYADASSQQPTDIAVYQVLDTAAPLPCR